MTNTKFLRIALRFDAAASGALGIASLTMAPLMKDWFGTALPMTYGVGAFLIVYSTALLLLAAPAQINTPGVWIVIIGNLGWVAASVALVLSDLASLTALGTGYVLLQAAAVVLFADLEFIGLRKARA